MISFGNIILTTGSGAWLETSASPGPTPAPQYSLRFKFSDLSYNPLAAYPIGSSTAWSPDHWKHGCTWTQISSNPNIWEYQREPDHYSAAEDPWGANAWNQEFLNKFDDYEHNQVEVLGGNTTGITSMNAMLAQNPGLVRVALFDTSAVYDMQQMLMGLPVPETGEHDSHLVEVPDFDFTSCLVTQGMFWGCEELETIPAFDLQGVCDVNRMFADCVSLQALPAAMRLSKVGHPIVWEGTVVAGTLQYMDYMFQNCRNVASGITEVYSALSSNGFEAAAQAAGVNPAQHAQVFENCGIDSATGRREWMDLPVTWK